MNLEKLKMKMAYATQISPERVNAVVAELQVAELLPTNGPSHAVAEVTTAEAANLMLGLLCDGFTEHRAADVSALRNAALSRFDRSPPESSGNDDSVSHIPFLPKTLDESVRLGDVLDYLLEHLSRLSVQDAASEETAAERMEDVVLGVQSGRRGAELEIVYDDVLLNLAFLAPRNSEEESEGGLNGADQQPQLLLGIACTRAVNLNVLRTISPSVR